MERLIQEHGLRYWVTVARRFGPETAAVVYWAEEFPSIRDEAIIFSAVDLGLANGLAEKPQELEQDE
jgi:hypothetical protein